MKFTVDTSKKVLTLLDKVSFKEINQLKKFIGDDWEKWTIEAKEVVHDVYHSNNYWWWYPYHSTVQYYGSTPVGTTLTSTNAAVFSNDQNGNQYYVNASDTALSTLTLKSITNDTNNANR